VPVQVRRLLVCPCHDPGDPKSFAALDLGGDAVAPELAYVTARYAALLPFGKVAALLSELLPVDGAQHASTVRNRALRVGEAVVQPYSTEIAEQPAAPAAGSVVVGLDGGYVRSRHPQEESHFEVIAGKVIDAEGVQHRFAFTRNGQAASAKAFREALAAAGVGANTPSTVLADGDAGLWRLQREVLLGATPVLDWWHAAMQFEHANRLSQNRTVAPHRSILAAISGALRPSSTACRTICARRTRPAPSVRERAIRATSSASSSPNARTRRVMAMLPSRTKPCLNALRTEKSQTTWRMHH
jgi:hypothetical protein